MLFINEIKYSIRQPLTLLIFTILPLVSYVLSVGLQIEQSSLIRHFQLSQMSLIMLTLPIVIAIFSVQIMQRDYNANMTELVNATPISNHHRKLLRFSAASGLTLLIFILSFIVSIIAYSSEFSFQNEFILYSISNILMLLLPSVLLGTASALLLSTYFRSNIVIYVSFSLFWIGYLFFASITGSPILAGSSIVSESLYKLALWVDPYGITVLIQQLKSADWFSNHYFLTNRGTYLLISVGIVYFALKVKPLEKKNRQIKKKKVSSRDNYHPPLLTWLARNL